MANKIIDNEKMPTYLKSFLCRIAPLGAGLAMAHTVGFWQVWRSNQHILRQSRALSEAGWLSIPCGPVIASLATFQTAFWGALFFTMSLGAGLCLVTWGVLSIVGRNGLRNWGVRIGIALAWAAVLFLVNAHDLLAGWSLFILLVPPTFGWIFLKCRSDGVVSKPRSITFLPYMPLILLALLWLLQWNADMFVTIRDQLLLSNSWGRKVNAFYYDYTMYAAEAFKSFEQKTVRTCSLSDIDDPSLARRLADRLTALNVLPLHDFQPVDLRIQKSQDHLILEANGSPVMTVPLQAFEADPGSWLIQFSDRSDRYGGLRQLIFISLLLAFPVLLYMIFYSLLKMLIGFLFKPAIAIWPAAGLCLATGIILLLPVNSFHRQSREKADVAAYLASPEREKRLVALMIIDRQKLDIGNWRQYEHLLNSADTAERYWTAHALAYTRTVESYGQLSGFLNDHEPIVRCQALYALGQRAEARAIEPVLAHITASDHWYVQWYGYGALRKLGWRQKALP